MYSDSGHFGVYAGTSADTANEMLAVTAQQLADIAAGVGDDEIERAKAQLRASLVMSRESVSGCGDSLARQIMMFGAPQDDEALLDSIIAVDAAAVRDVAAGLVAGGRPAGAASQPSGRGRVRRPGRAGGSPVGWRCARTAPAMAEGGLAWSAA